MVIIPKQGGQTVSDQSLQYWRKKQAANDNNPNKILLLFDMRTAHALFEHSLNAETASKMTDKELLSLKNIGPTAVKSIRKAMRTAQKDKGEKFSV
ncbi:TPA: hypothetical protein DCZ46_03390 [Candidatus Campbellbacteria bacterium]|nr:MAG: hypothetical protein UR58_C0001G0648 [Candidatus Campbellbacteria bacterium GW2011_OD1_34_28]HAP74115.1 hypothetical protein [Candidatus Campbellbacteria bacterium]HAQ01622.1 hypothetical protein [Candidatus Campbellbacteria bacterium]HBC70973.1 hypothetical protein [Candidatus Campbellbacteria bacterium]